MLLRRDIELGKCVFNGLFRLTDCFPSPSGRSPSSSVHFQSSRHERQSEAWGLWGPLLQPRGRRSQLPTDRIPGGRKHQLEDVHRLHHERPHGDDGKDHRRQAGTCEGRSHIFVSANICLILKFVALVRCSCFCFKWVQLAKKLPPASSCANQPG